ncbi:MAG: carboxylesterase family protein [Verrucomicrobiae bacterium]|nr:carboxylesterase family protein [Verrucomicrobiae bacterium]
MHACYGDAAKKILRLYPGKSGEKLTAAISRFVTDAWFVHPSRQLLDGMAQVSSPAYQYQFSRSHPTKPDLGAPHAIDVRYVFNTLDESFDSDADNTLANHVTDYWVQFAKAGNPNTENLPPWPEYKLKQAAYLDFDLDIKVGNHLNQQAFEQLEAANLKLSGVE